MFGYVRGVLSRLLKLPYGIVESGRQWQKTVETWMLTEGGLQRFFGLSQLFIRRDGHGRISLIVAKVTDDFLIGGRTEIICKFIDRMKRRFDVGKVVIDDKFHFDGCEIQQENEGNIRMSMMGYIDRLRPIKISRQRSRERDDLGSDAEKKQYRSLAGALLYLGNGVLPQALLVTSMMQQKLPRLTVQGLVIASDMLKELLSLKSWLTYQKPVHTKSVILSTFSDAAHPRDRDYGQTGLITGLRVIYKDGLSEIFHLIDRTSRKQKRVSYSSYGSEILAAAHGDARGYYYKIEINSLFPNRYTKQ